MQVVADGYEIAAMVKGGISSCWWPDKEDKLVACIYKGTNTKEYPSSKLVFSTWVLPYTRNEHLFIISFVIKFVFVLHHCFEKKNTY